jgi:hypothetical protein
MLRMSDDTVTPDPEQPDLPDPQEDQEAPAAGPVDPVPDDEAALLQEPTEPRPSPYTGDDVRQDA